MSRKNRKCLGRVNQRKKENERIKIDDTPENVARALFGLKPKSPTKAKSSSVADRKIYEN